jgi:hypothetical protein
MSQAAEGTKKKADDKKEKDKDTSGLLPEEELVSISA